MKQVGPNPDFGFDVIKVIDLLLQGQGNILEFGSGYSSKYLVDHGYKVTSIEHDPNWVDKFEGVDYIYAPITELPYSKSYEKRFPNVKTWYDGEAIKKGIEGKTFNLMIIDGPPKYIGRCGLYVHRELFDWSVPVIWDNTDRRVEIFLANLISFGLQHKGFLTVHNTTGWSFSVTSPNKDDFKRIIDIL